MVPKGVGVITTFKRDAGETLPLEDSQVAVRAIGPHVCPLDSSDLARFGHMDAPAAQPLAGRRSCGLSMDASGLGTNGI